MGGRAGPKCGCKALNIAEVEPNSHSNLNGSYPTKLLGVSNASYELKRGCNSIGYHRGLF